MTTGFHDHRSYELPQVEDEINTGTNSKHDRAGATMPGHGADGKGLPDDGLVDGCMRKESLEEEIRLKLLRRYEPIARFTKGERFYPIDVERYVRLASLWIQQPGEDAQRLVGSDQLTLERLGAVAETDTDTDAVQFLKFTDPLAVRELASYYLSQESRQRRQQNAFVPGVGRLARVGYVSRFVDAMYNLALLARGRVPGDTAAAAALTYEQMMSAREGFSYHGRVVREAGWIVLQYWYFYVYNNWRSGFSGANDHEADWEMISIYLPNPGNGPDAYGKIPGKRGGETDLSEYRPEWIAYASHDRAGDDLRRRWDDPEVEKEGNHPVVYVGAGSHASYFQPGEYLTELELKFLTPLEKISGRVLNFWHHRMRQYQAETEADANGETSNIFRIPFVDYARGDGLSIGPGQDTEWETPRVLHGAEPWLTKFRGLWGLYTRDPFAGENAPAGPMYERNQQVRRAWYDPVGWAGLDKVAPPGEAVAVTRVRQHATRKRTVALEASVDEKTQMLRSLGVEAEAMRSHPYLQMQLAEHQRQMAELSEEINELRRTLVMERELFTALQVHERQICAGEKGPSRVHIRRAHIPTGAEELRASQLAEIWAAASIGLVLVGFVALIYFARHYLVFGLVAIISVLMFLEATFRGRLVRLVTGVTIGLAVVASMVLLYEFFWWVMAIGALTVGGYLLWENLREVVLG